MKKYNVLIFPSGGENALNIFDSLRYNIHFNLYGANSKNDFSNEIYGEGKLFVGDLFITNPNFINNFNDVIKLFDIDFIIPAHDTVAMYLMENEKSINATIVCSNYESAKIGNSKYEMYHCLDGKFYLPKIFDYDNVNEFPIFAKPDVGAGGKGARIINNFEELKELKKSKNKYVLCEYLPGDEYTIDCFTDKNGKLLFIGPRTRERVTMGISFYSRTIPLDEYIKKIAYDLNKEIKFRGAWFFQLKKDKNNNYKLLEFSVRQAGTMALYRELGVNFALLSLFDRLDYDLNIIYNEYGLSLNRRLVNSYKLNYEFDKIFIDFDDTLIIDGKVNTTLLKLIYQQKRKGKKIILLTKHESNIYKDLKHYYIDKDLFDNIYNIGINDKKSSYIEPDRSVFIDNYFSDRLDVYEKCNIPVFDVDAVECLIDFSDI